MNEEQRNEILVKAKEFIRKEIFEPHLENSLSKATKVKNYKIHPFLINYISNFLEGNDDPETIAKALIYPRVLGTSITTTFGNKAQKMIGQLFSGLGSAVPGIDIEFIDSIDQRKKYCQLKAGPNTINKDDVATVKGHFTGIKYVARVNNIVIGTEDLVVGVLYGSNESLSGHYRKIAKDFPVFVGKEFWHRLTGREDFYSELIDAIGEEALKVDGKERLEKAIKALAIDIEKNLRKY